MPVGTLRRRDRRFGEVESPEAVAEGANQGIDAQPGSLKEFLGTLDEGHTASRSSASTSFVKRPMIQGPTSKNATRPRAAPPEDVFASHTSCTTS